MRTTSAAAAGLILMVSLMAETALSQSTQGRWMVGLHGGANMWISDFDKYKIGPGAEIVARYGVSRTISLGLMGGYEELKTEQSAQTPESPFIYQKLKAFPAALLLTVHFAPMKSTNWYFYVGGGAMLYQRLVDTGIPFPDDAYRTTYIVPAGVGLDAFLSNNVAFTVSAGFTNIGDWVDTRENSSPDGYVTAKAGLNFYLGSSDADDNDEDGLTNGQERRLGTNPDNPDTDGDMLKDGEEVNRYRSNPLKTDTDGDGLADGDEVLKYRTDPARFDTDNDGLSDGEEVTRLKTDPTKADTDGDGLSDGEEVLRVKSDPLRVDTDGDSLSDWDEVRVYKTNPNVPDTDADALRDGDEVKKHRTDPLKVDTDAGGVNDGAEVQRGTDPLDPRDDIVADPIVLERGASVLLEGVNFASGSATLTRDSEETLERVFIALVANPKLNVEIAGYTDNTGSVRGNERLSRRRAESVRSWLVGKGIDSSRMTVVGMGPKDPIAPNSTSQGRAKNRRIEFHVK
jgi:outer membrane protein OmpA-like peptidoglycan-associated protein